MKFSAALVCVAAFIAPVLAVDIPVIVGAAEDGSPALTFRPNQITANVGDRVQFQFRGGNHTVTQSSFANPCAQQFNTATNQPGFTSPFIPYNAASGTIGVYTLEITQATSPIWFFCARNPHCNSGMVGAINAPATGDKSFDRWFATVATAQAPGFGQTVPFTPPANNGNNNGNNGLPNNGNNGQPINGGLTPINSGILNPTQTGAQPTNGASSLSVRSGVVVALAGLAAGLVL
jgi:plastocyanin